MEVSKTPVAFDDVTLDRVRPDELDAVFDTLLPKDGEDVEVPADFRQDLEMLVKVGFIRAVRVKGEDGRDKIAGVIVIDQDSADSRAMTLSFSRLRGDAASRGEMTIGGIKAAEVLTRKIGLPTHHERQQLREQGQWETQRQSELNKLEAQPIHAYVKPFNIKSRRMLERIGFVEKGMGGETHEQEMRYVLDLDSLDSAWEKYSQPQNSSSEQKKAA